MTDKPDAAALLEEARRTLLETLLPLLPPERRYDGLMVANAMAIAVREAGQGGALPAEAVRRLAALFPEPASDPRENLQDRLLAFERRLAREIRAGRCDADARRTAVGDYLRWSVAARLGLSNPKALPNP
jgi:hypothetical protein